MAISTWILVIMMSGGYYGSSPAVSTQEFNSKDSCMTAASFLRKQSAYLDRDLTVVFSCVEK